VLKFRAFSKEENHNCFKAGEGPWDLEKGEQYVVAWVVFLSKLLTEPFNYIDKQMLTMPFEMRSSSKVLLFTILTAPTNKIARHSKRNASQPFHSSSVPSPTIHSSLPKFEPSSPLIFYSEPPPYILLHL
jgi:hypothetical protein